MLPPCLLRSPPSCLHPLHPLTHIFLSLVLSLLSSLLGSRDCIFFLIVCGVARADNSSRQSPDTASFSLWRPQTPRSCTRPFHHECSFLSSSSRQFRSCFHTPTTHHLPITLSSCLRRFLAPSDPNLPSPPPLLYLSCHKQIFRYLE